jgi:hypothetical protein
LFEVLYRKCTKETTSSKFKDELEYLLVVFFQQLSVSGAIKRRSTKKRYRITIATFQRAIDFQSFKISLELGEDGFDQEVKHGNKMNITVSGELE